MKKMNFAQIEVILGGQQFVTCNTSTTVPNSPMAQKSCLKEGAVFIGSAILSLGTTGFTAGLSWGLTALAYSDYFACQYQIYKAV